MKARQISHRSVMVPVGGKDQLHLLRLHKDRKHLGAPVLMVSGQFHGGDVFMGESGGLAAFLAEQGYDVFVADMRGRGKSWPQINHYSDFGYHEIITQDLPALVKKVSELRPGAPQVWVSHGWGAVWLCSYYARYGDSHGKVARMVHFAPRRRSALEPVRQQLWYRWIGRRLARWLVKFYGYLPAKAWRIGHCDTSTGCYKDFLQWSQQEQWIDSRDGFRYDLAVHDQLWPPSYYFAAEKDQVQAPPADVRRFVRELAHHDGRLMVLSRSGGNQLDYDHEQMVNHRAAEQDHFPQIVDWLRGAA